MEPMTLADRVEAELLQQTGTDALYISGRAPRGIRHGALLMEIRKLEADNREMKRQNKGFWRADHVKPLTAEDIRSLADLPCTYPKPQWVLPPLPVHAAVQELAYAAGWNQEEIDAFIAHPIIRERLEQEKSHGGQEGRHQDTCDTDISREGHQDASGEGNAPEGHGENSPA